MSIDVRLDAFEGPLALLLKLIEQNEIDINDIPVASLTDQYIAVIETLPQDMDGLSEFLLMAATLLEIKSRTLLPQPPAPAGEEPEDPRGELVRKLLEYKQMQELAGRLRAAAPSGERFVRADSRAVYAYEPEITQLCLEGVELSMLWRAYYDAARRRESRIDTIHARYGDMPRERFTMEAQIARLTSWLNERAPFKLSELFGACGSRGEMLAAFLALLELTRRGLLRTSQRAVFGDIICERGVPAVCTA